MRIYEINIFKTFTDFPLIFLYRQTPFTRFSTT